jgi:hypothetical protein
VHCRLQTPMEAILPAWSAHYNSVRWQSLCPVFAIASPVEPTPLIHRWSRPRIGRQAEPFGFLSGSGADITKAVAERDVTAVLSAPRADQG